MNLAFAALLIILLAVPGFLFFYFFRAERGRPPTSRPFADELPLAVTVAVVIHAVVGSIFHFVGECWFGVGAQPSAAVRLLSNEFGKDGAEFDIVTQCLFAGWRPVALTGYFITTCVVGAALGGWLNHLLESGRFERLRLDRWL